MDLFCCSNARSPTNEDPPMAALDRDEKSTIGGSGSAKTVQDLEANAARGRRQRLRNLKKEEDSAVEASKQDDIKAAAYMENRIAELEAELAVKKEKEVAEAIQKEKEQAAAAEQAKAKEDAASTIQGALRGNESRKQTDADLVLVEQAQARQVALNQAARSIQGGLRGAQTRQDTAAAIKEGTEQAEALIVAAYRGKATRDDIHQMVKLAEATVEAELAEAEAAKTKPQREEPVGESRSREAALQEKLAKKNDELMQLQMSMLDGTHAAEVKQVFLDDKAAQDRKMRDMEEQLKSLLALQVAQNAALAAAQRDLLEEKQTNKGHKRELRQLKKADTETERENLRLKEELLDMQSRFSPQPSTIAPSENTDYSRLDVADFDQEGSDEHVSPPTVVLPEAELERSKLAPVRSQVSIQT